MKMVGQGRTSYGACDADPGGKEEHIRQSMKIEEEKIESVRKIDPLAHSL